MKTNMIQHIKEVKDKLVSRFVSFSPPVGYALILAVMRMAITQGDRIAAISATVNTSRAARFSPSLRRLYFRQRNALRA